MAASVDGDHVDISACRSGFCAMDGFRVIDRQGFRAANVEVEPHFEIMICFAGRGSAKRRGLVLLACMGFR